MHWIQKHILRQLSVHGDRRYSQLKPDDVDGNLFMYHLRQLQKAHYVSRAAGNYQLSEQGKLFASRMSLAKASPQIQPKIVAMLVCQNENGEFLLFRWRRQPYFGLVSFPFSKMLFGQPIAERLGEALLHKTNLHGQFDHAGDAYIRTHNEHGDVIDHTLAHIFIVSGLSGELWADGMTGQPFWATAEAAREEHVVPSFWKILELIQLQERGFFKEITVSPDSGDMISPFPIFPSS